ncbi:MAG: glycoside hydrolase family 88 protein [Akkermansiaceae bacterium]|nr:glycoside hydrolase family 88 protein [Akkermansiaceae bacterium]
MKKQVTPMLAAILLTAGVSAQEDALFSADLTPAAILKVTNAAAKWQLDHPAKHPLWHWTHGALWTGVMAHAHTTGDETYYRTLADMGAKTGFKLGPRPGFSDDHAVGQAYLWLYMRDELPQQIAHTRQTMDDFINRPHDEPLEWKNKIYLREPAWCDSLYMSPPTLAMLYAATGEKRYLDAMDMLWWRTTDYLFDKESKLYWRDQNYFDRKEKNGEKVFWARGNGWVFAGICNLLKHIPHDYPSRPRYLALFKEMAAKLKDIQQPDGSWHAALLDPDTYPAPESSGTAFYIYGMAWGINNGLLPEADYLPVCTKGWQRLVRNVHADGKLGFVQAIGKDPKAVTKDETDVYGVGGFLLVGHELHKMALTKGAKTHDFHIGNPSSLTRRNQVVSLKWADVKKHLPAATAQNTAVMDRVSGYFLPVQNFDDSLLVQVSLMPGESRKFTLFVLENGQPAHFPSRLHARFVPERLDDFAWENDRMAFRMYGPALVAEDGRGGIDVWTKRVRYPIVDKWYKAGPTQYHTDHGEGMDAYKVGQTLGCGGLGYLDKQGKLIPSPVFATSKVITKGPLRLKFILTYPPLAVDGAKVTETRTVTMDAGSHFLHVTSSFKTEGDSAGIRPVTGLYVHDKKSLAYTGDEEAQSIFQTNHAIAAWEPLGNPEENHGFIGTSIVSTLPDLTTNLVWDEKHPLVPLARDLTNPVSWYAGTSWSQVDAPRKIDFENRVLRFIHENITAPLNIEL